MLTEGFFLQTSPSEFVEQSEMYESRGDIFQRGCVSEGVEVCGCVCLYVHFGRVERLQMKPIHIPDMRAFIRKLQHQSADSTACNWLTELNISALDKQKTSSLMWKVAQCDLRVTTVLPLQCLK